MLILGKDSDDKGHQLERLTCNLLAAIGYTDIVTNLVGAGGQEIDVRARYIIPDLGDGGAVSVLCECKAYKGPVALPAWHQFLGKLFHQLTVSAEEVRGCFIALSGVNGNVQGNYETLRQARGRVKLVTGSDLFRLMANHFHCADLDAIVRKIQRMTDRRHREAELAY